MTVVAVVVMAVGAAVALAAAAGSHGEPMSSADLGMNSAAGDDAVAFGDLADQGGALDPGGPGYLTAEVVESPTTVPTLIVSTPGDAEQTSTQQWATAELSTSQTGSTVGNATTTQPPASSASSASASPSTTADYVPWVLPPPPTSIIPWVLPPPPTPSTQIPWVLPPPPSSTPTIPPPSWTAPTSPSPSPSPTTTQPASGRVVWQDNFDRLDLSVWAPEHSTYGDGNYELQCYRPENVTVADSKLILRARHETYTCPNGSTRRVTSGMVRSSGVTFGPGQAIEFRVKLNPANPDDQAGLWPAVWSSGWAGGWPQGGELDYLEVMTAEDPRRAMFSMHYANRSNSHSHQNRGEVLDRYFSDEWHEIRFEYGRNGNLVWFLDGRETFRVTNAETLQGYPAPFDRATGEIKINLALGGRPGPLSWGALGTSGATFEVDWIRIVEL